MQNPSKSPKKYQEQKAKKKNPAPGQARFSPEDGKQLKKTNGKSK